jgi:N-acetylneuraminic acid mutarotase
VQAVPPVLNYAGQVAVNGEAYDGNGLFKFALVNTDGTTTYWSNDGTSVDGSEPQASVAVPVNGGLYAVLLGNTALQGMGAIDPSVFVQHTDAKLRVWFSDGVNGFQQLSPDRPFASVPYAFNAKSSDTALNAETAKRAESANVATTAMAVQAGAINKQMLGQDVLSDLNRTVNHNDLSPQIKADINATIGMNRLSTEVTEKLNQEKTTNNYNAPSVGSLLAVPYGSDAPAGYSLYQRGEPKELVWEEKAPVSVARYVGDGAVILENEIYVIGGWIDGNTIGRRVLEKYDPLTDTWKNLASTLNDRVGTACTALNGKLYAIGGVGLSSVEIYDPSTNSWSTGQVLPREVRYGTAITVNGMIYLVGGRDSLDAETNSVYCYDPSSNEWTIKASISIPRHAIKLLWYENRIWAVGGRTGSTAMNVFESYGISTNEWRTEKSFGTPRSWSFSWQSHNRIYVGGGHSPWINSLEAYNLITNKWQSQASIPENKGVADAVVLNDKVYVIGGRNSSSTYSNKVFAADLNASVEGVYDLYRKNGDAPVGTPVVQSEYADGSVTTSKLDATILKYLKPEITSQPQEQTVYGDTNVSYSVTAEGKYLTYQWKKDGVDLVGETNATLNITDANSTQHDGNYSIVVTNDFGSVQSGVTEIVVATTWIPLALPRLELWLDASDVSNVIKDSNNLVSELRDKSSNKFHAVQYNVSRQPTYTASNSLLNNKPSVLSTSAFGSIGLITPLITFREIFIVAYYKGGIETSFGDYNTLLAGGGHNGAYRIMGMRNSPNWNLEGAFNDGGNFKNGTTDSSITILPLPPTVLRFVSSSAKSQHTGILYNPLFNDRGWLGGIGEIVALKSLSSISDRQKIEGYLAHKWGLAASLPTGHPYKTNAP